MHSAHSVWCLIIFYLPVASVTESHAWFIAGLENMKFSLKVSCPPLFNNCRKSDTFCRGWYPWALSIQKTENWQGKRLRNGIFLPSTEDVSSLGDSKKIPTVGRRPSNWTVFTILFLFFVLNLTPTWFERSIIQKYVSFARPTCMSPPSPLLCLLPPRLCKTAVHSIQLLTKIAT